MLMDGRRKNKEEKGMSEKSSKAYVALKEAVESLTLWSMVSVVTGLLIGVIASVFAHVVEWATEYRNLHPMLVLGLPIGGIVIVALYKVMGQEKNTGTNMVLTVLRSDHEVMPATVTPLILISTSITHLFGGSSGREGAALQFGASVGSTMGRYLQLNESNRKILILASMSAAFAALFGTPLAAAIFPMEVISVGVMYYAALVPCMFSAFIAEYVSVLLGVRTFKIPYLVENVPDFFTDGNALKVIALAACFAMAGVLFCTALHKSEHLFSKWCPNPYLKVCVGAVCVIGLSFLLGTQRYLGLGEATIHASFVEAQGFEHFLLKILFTCLTLCVGFKGGEIVPTLFIGATLGSALSVVVNLPPSLCAACGMVGVFCAVTNSPISSMLIALELFGSEGMQYYCLAVSISYLLSGYQSLYKEQKIVYSKTENKYINRPTE